MYHSKSVGKKTEKNSSNITREKRHYFHWTCNEPDLSKQKQKQIFDIFKVLKKITVNLELCNVPQEFQK